MPNLLQHISILTLYTKLAYDKLKSKLSSIVDFAFKGDHETILSNNSVAYWGRKTKEWLGFNKISLRTAINNLIEKCYFNVGNVTMKQEIDIPMGLVPAPFWVNLSLYSYDEKTHASTNFFW